MYQSTSRNTGRGGTAVRLTLAIASAGSLAAAVPQSARAGPTAGDVAISTDTAPPQIGQVQFSRRSVSVSGLAVVPVTVSVHLTDASGVEETPSGLDGSPRLTLAPVPGPWSRLAPVLARTSGTARDGVWSATVNVPSTWNGTVRIVSVGAADLAGNVRYQEFTGPSGPALRVIGTHRPALTFNYASLAGGGFRIHGRAYFTDTRRPIRRMPLATAYDANCDLEGGAVNDIATNARGYYEKRWPHGDVAAAGCVALTRPAAPGQRPTVLAYHIASAPTPAIPDAAMLASEHVHDAYVEPVTDGSWSTLRPPQPCARDPYRSATLLRAERAVSALIGVGDRPTSVMAHVATYRSNGAQRYLRELRRALAACGGRDEQGGRWTVGAAGVAGDESLLLVHRTYVDYAATYHNTYVVVARVGRVLVVVADVGWETASGHEALVRELSTTAVRRAAILNGR